MSRFANKNMNGGYGNYDRVQEQGYNGIAYSARHDATSYRAQTEQVVYYPATTHDHEYMIGSPRKDAPPPRIHNIDRAPEKNPNYHDPFSSPRSRDEPARGVPTKNLPYWNNGIGDNNSPSKDRYPAPATRDHGKHVHFNSGTKTDHDSDEDDEHAGKGRVWPKYYDDEYAEDEKKRRNGEKVPTFAVPITNPAAKKDSSPPFATQPRDISRYETVVPNNNKSATASPPQYNSRPGRMTDQKPALSGGQETIDSTEARRRYGKASAEAGNYAVDRHASGGTIDCKEAAKRYNGIFLPN